MSTEPLSANDRRAALVERWPTWQPITIDGLLDRAAEEFADRDYLITDQQTWTYAQVKAWSERLAGGLHSLGVTSGDHVAMVMANHPEFVAMKYAIARVGATCIPINFLNRRDELGYVLGQSDASVLVTMDSFRGLDYLAMLDELAPGWETGGGGDAFPKLNHVVVVLPDSTAEVRKDARSFADLEQAPAFANICLLYTSPSPRDS